MAFTQLVYTSYLAADELVFQDILRSADRNNQKNNITGMLLYVHGRLLQVIEGEEHAVRGTFARIRADRGHRDVIAIMDQQVPAREFSRFCMGFRKVEESDIENALQYLPIPPAEFKESDFEGKPGVALDLLKFFAMKLSNEFNNEISLASTPKTSI